MTRHPFDPSELDRGGADVEDVAAELEAYAARTEAMPPHDLTQRIRTRLQSEPPPGMRWGWLTGWTRSHRPAAGALMAVAVVTVAIIGAMAFGEVVSRLRQLDVGATPQPEVTAPPTVTPAPTPTLAPSPSPPTPPPTSTPTPPPAPSPTESDDEEVETPEPSETEDDDDNSGPGGGNSGPGGDD